VTPLTPHQAFTGPVADAHEALIFVLFDVQFSIGNVKIAKHVKKNQIK